MIVPASESRRFFFNQKATDFLVFAASPDDRHVGQTAVGDPCFGPIQDKTAALFAGDRPQPAWVRTKVRLCQTEAANGVTRLQTRQPLLLLFPAAEGVDGVHHQPTLHRNEAPQPAVTSLEFLHDQPVGDAVQTRAVVTFEIGSEITQLAHRLDQM